MFDIIVKETPNFRQYYYICDDGSIEYKEFRYSSDFKKWLPHYNRSYLKGEINIQRKLAVDGYKYVIDRKAKEHVVWKEDLSNLDLLENKLVGFVSNTGSNLQIDSFKEWHKVFLKDGSIVVLL